MKLHLGEMANPKENSKDSFQNTTTTESVPDLKHQDYDKSDAVLEDDYQGMHEDGVHIPLKLSNSTDTNIKPENFHHSCFEKDSKDWQEEAENDGSVSRKDKESSEGIRECSHRSDQNESCALKNSQRRKNIKKINQETDIPIGNTEECSQMLLVRNLASSKHKEKPEDISDECCDHMVDAGAKNSVQDAISPKSDPKNMEHGEKDTMQSDDEYTDLSRKPGHINFVEEFCEMEGLDHVDFMNEKESKANDVEGKSCDSRISETYIPQQAPIFPEVSLEKLFQEEGSLFQGKNQEFNFKIKTHMYSDYVKRPQSWGFYQEKLALILKMFFGCQSIMKGNIRDTVNVSGKSVPDRNTSKKDKFGENEVNCKEDVKSHEFLQLKGITSTCLEKLFQECGKPFQGKYQEFSFKMKPCMHTDYVKRLLSRGFYHENFALKKMFTMNRNTKETVNVCYPDIKFHEISLLKEITSTWQFFPMFARFMEYCLPCSLQTFFERFINGIPISLAERMSYEWLRLDSFNTLPSSFRGTAIRLAQSGFYYTRQGTRIRCYACNVEHEGWNNTDDPHELHQRISPTCPFLRGNPTYPNYPIIPDTVHSGNNTERSASSATSVTIQERTQSRVIDTPQVIIPSINTSITPDLEEVSIPQVEARRESATIHDSSISQTQQQSNSYPITATSQPETIPSSSSRNHPQQPTERPKHPEHASLSSRISSYTSWPVRLDQTPQQLAKAGFFYTGINDYTRCFHCGGRLMNWEPGDNPWIEHARWYPECAYVLGKKGQKFVNAVLQKQSELVTLDTSKIPMRMILPLR